MLNIEAIAGASFESSPFPHCIAHGVLDAEALAAVESDFPPISKPGVFPPSQLRFGPAFAQLLADVESSELEAALEEKYQIALRDKPLMVTVRGHCRARDGRIHNDSMDKIITCLLYLNAQGWEEKGGRLRFLRDPANIDDVITEIPPLGGVFASFRRTDNSWHGHESYEGPRRYIMLNWLASEAALAKNVARHKISAAFKHFDLFDY